MESLKEDALREAIRLSKGRSHLAKKVGVAGSTITFWLNQAEKIPFDKAILIELKTGISRYDLAPEKRYLKLVEAQLTRPRALTWVEKTLLGLEYEKQIKNDELPSDLKEDFLQFKGKKRDWLAEVCGFGCGKTFEKSAFIVKRGSDILLNEMDKQILSIDLLFRLAKLTYEKQHMIMLQDKKKILKELKQIFPSSKNHFVQQVYEDRELKALEKHQQKPLRLALLSLYCIQLIYRKIDFRCETLEELFIYFNMRIDDCVHILKQKNWLKHFQVKEQVYA